jgi:hypothetical protein
MASTDEVGITLQVHASKNRTKLLPPEFFADLKIMNPHSGALVGNQDCSGYEVLSGMHEARGKHLRRT